MIDNFLEILFLIKYPLIGLFFSFATLSFCWSYIFEILKLKSYDNVQRVHKHEIPRLGGLLIYFFFWIIHCLGYVKDDLFFHLLIAAIPFILISLKEDLFHNSAPTNRLLAMILSCLIFFYVNPVVFPVIDIPYVNVIISFYPISILFFTFSILVVMNGMNLIDGMNGLFSFSALFQLVALSYIAFLNHDFECLRLIFLISAALVLFLFFNFPFGRIFAGDLGAYLYGFIISNITIYLFGKYNLSPTWLAVLILFYPCIELLFSFIRKIKLNKSPFDPDNNHLHTLIYFNFIIMKMTHTQSALLTTVFIITFLNPLLWLSFINFEMLNVSIVIIFYSLLYVLLYKFFYLRKYYA